MEKRELLQLISQMTLKEKAGQLMQITPQFFETGEEGAITGPLQEMGLTEEELYTVGSVLGTQSKEQVTKIQESYLNKSRLKIPLLFMADIIHGYQTIFPIPLAIGASFNPEVAQTVASYSAKEASEAGIHVTFSPMVDLVKDPRWGRVLEATGEDKYLNSLFAAAFVKGYQGNSEDLAQNKEKIAACVKHFVAYGAVQAGREYNTVDVSSLNLYENYLPSFEAAIDAGVKLVMTSFNTVKGIPSTGNKWLLEKVLRQDLNFKGMVISDWAAVEELISHRVASSQKEAALKAISAGCDMDMMTACYIHYLPELVEEGKVSEKRVNQAVLQVLELKNDLGLFENPLRSYQGEESFKDSQELREASRKTARETLVLLKNQQAILPLNKNKKIALVGPLATSKEILGSWSYLGPEGKTITLAKGVLEKDPSITIAGTKNRTTFTPEEENDMLQIAKENEVVIVALGEGTEETGEAASKGDISLPKAQIDLLKALKKVNSNIVTLLFNGRPLLLEEVMANSQAVLECFFPGSEGGRGVADVLFGEVAPTGKLPMSFPYTVGQIPLTYDELSTGRPETMENKGGGYISNYLDQPNEPFLPFGYGLTYGELVITKVDLPSNFKEDLVLKVGLKNPGKQVVTETLQVYIQDKFAEVALPKRSLKYIEKVTLGANEEKEITVTLPHEVFTYTHFDLTKKADPGDFDVFVGFDSRCQKFGTSHLTEN